MTTGFLWHSVYGWNDVGSGSLGPADSSRFLSPIQGVAHPDTKRRAYELIEASGLLRKLQRLEPEPAKPEDVLLFHDKAYLEQIQRGNEQLSGQDLSDGVSHFGKGGYEIALLGLGGGLTMLEAVMSGKLANGYALINPPGHHAQPEQGMGFCMFNNVGICAEAALKKFGAKRVAIVDFDVHHGNGAEKGFYARHDVLTISIHQDRCFPATTGFATSQGEGEGLGYNFNVPLPAGAGNPAYIDAFERAICPALVQYKPDVILVASGQDANIMDPLARQMVTTVGYKSITEQLLRTAKDICGGKILFLQEGGYNPHYVPFCVHEIVATLVGSESLADPFLPLWSQYETDAFEERHRAVVDEAVSRVDKIRSP